MFCVFKNVALLFCKKSRRKSTNHSFVKLRVLFMVGKKKKKQFRTDISKIISNETEINGTSLKKRGRKVPSSWKSWQRKWLGFARSHGRPSGMINRLTPGVRKKVIILKQKIQILHNILGFSNLPTLKWCNRTSVAKILKVS